jgi:Zn-dependent protease
MLSDLSGTDLLIVLVSLVISLAIHEAMHGFVAHALGDDTAQLEGRLTLNPLAHIDVFTTVLLPFVMILAHVPPIFAAKPVPISPQRLKFGDFGSALVGVAGPLTNLVLAGLAAIFFHAFVHDPSSFFYNALIIFTEVNVAFFIFNMIPIPPLDGSRLLYAFAPEPLQELMMQIEAAGFLTIIFIFVIIINFASGPIVQIQSDIVNFLLA